MNEPVGSAIEKIKLQEQDIETKLRKKREHEAALASLGRAIKDEICHSEKYDHEKLEINKRIEKLRPLLEIEKLKRDALSAQLKTFTEMLNDLRVQSDRGITKVWSLRSLLCETVQNVSNECDIWPLLMRPMYTNTDLLPYEVKNSENHENIVIKKDRLQAALERRERAVSEREKLLSEPDTGEEFIRKLFKSNQPKRLFSSAVEPNENAPIKFSTSEAARSRVPPVIKYSKHSESIPWYQPFSVVGSVAVFLIYFCVLREENDVDQEFNKTLYDRIKGLEKVQLLQSYQFNKEHGKSVVDIEKRLKEIEAEEAQLAQ